MKPAFSVPADVLGEYGLDDAFIELLTGGRTNRTMRARAGRDLVLQQMFGRTHPDLLGVMENLVRVTSHLDWRRSIDGDTASWYPQLVPSRAGKPFLMTSTGDVWRAFSYRPGQIVRSTQPVTTLASAGRMYGRFTKETANLGGPPLIETAPGFHDLEIVFDTLCADLEHCSAQRRLPVLDDLPRITKLKAQIDAQCIADGVVWSNDRVVHNDTKLSNVLFDRDHGRATAVLDLDLAMMGPSWHDVGDLFRSACWHAPTNAVSPNGAPGFSVELFDSVVGAFVDAAGATLSDAEIVTYAAAGPRLSLELGLRYLNDHLRDEPHLQVRGDSGHLIRGRANVNLAEEMLGAYDALRKVVDVFLAERPGTN